MHGAEAGDRPRAARVWHREASLPQTDLIVLPGGFAYGDYLRCGAMAAHSPIMREVRARADRGTPVLGICNGFQILTEAGILPGALLPNRSLRFICRDIHLRVENSQTIFTCGYEAGQTIRVPIAAPRRQLHRRPRHARPARRPGPRRLSLLRRRWQPRRHRKFQRLGARDRRHLQRKPDRAGPDAASRKRHRPALGGTDGQAFFHGLVGALQ